MYEELSAAVLQLKGLLCGSALERTVMLVEQSAVLVLTQLHSSQYQRVDDSVGSHLLGQLKTEANC